MNLLSTHSSSISTLCSKHKVKNLYAFGSVLNDQFNSSSDVDLIVKFDEIDLQNYANNYFDFKFSLEALFNRPVDLIEENAIRNPYFKNSVESARKLIYGN